MPRDLKKDLEHIKELSGPYFIYYSITTRNENYIKNFVTEFKKPDNKYREIINYYLNDPDKTKYIDFIEKIDLTKKWFDIIQNIVLNINELYMLLFKEYKHKHARNTELKPNTLFGKEYKEFINAPFTDQNPINDLTMDLNYDDFINKFDTPIIRPPIIHYETLYKNNKKYLYDRILTQNAYTDNIKKTNKYITSTLFSY